MSWLAPWFLAALVTLSLPLWLHRLQARNPQRQLFSSIMLLQAQEQRLRRQKQLRYRLLLGLRLALLALLVCAFAQPLWHRPPLAARNAVTHVILIDDSLSMSAGDHLSQARELAQRLIGAWPADERGIVASVSDHAEAVSRGAAAALEDAGGMRAAVAQVLPSAARLDFGAGLGTLDSLLGDIRGAVQLDFISDCQDSGTPPRFADLLPRQSPQRSVLLVPHCLPVSSMPNWTVSTVRAAGDGIDATVRGFNSPTRTLSISLDINGTERGRQMLSVPAGAQADAHFPRAVLGSGDNRVTVRIDAGDALPADDVRYTVLSNTPAQAVLLLSAQLDSLAARYVATAFAADGAHYEVEQRPLAQFGAATLAHYRWVIVDDLGAADAAHLTLLSQFVSSGGALFASLGASTQLQRQLPLLGDGIGPAIDSDDAVSVGALDVTHPLLADARGWQGLNIARLVTVQPSAADRVLVATSTGAPLLLERALGAGRVLVFTSTLDNDWNDLPVQPLFVSLLAQIGRYLDGRSQLRRTQTIGNSLSIAGSDGGAGQVIDPSGRELLSLAQTHRTAAVRLDQAGFYRVYTPGQEALLAVNPDVRESDLAPMSDAAVQRWRSAAAALRPAAAQSGTGTARDFPVAPWLLLAAVLLVLIESVTANLTLQRHRPRAA